MNCEHMMELMQRYVDDDLTTREELELEAHVISCSNCTATFARLKMLSAELEQLPQVKPRYSIVDTILPKLAELDRQQESEREESATLVVEDSIDGLHNRSRTRGFFANISWKITGGVAVAACAAMFFFWNDQSMTPSQSELASQVAPVLKDTSSVNEPMAQASTGTIKTEKLQGTEITAPDNSLSTTEPIHNDGLMTGKTTKVPEVSALTHEESVQAKGKSVGGTARKEDNATNDASTNERRDSTPPAEEETEQTIAVTEQPATNDPDDLLSTMTDGNGLVGQNMHFLLGNKLPDLDLRTANGDYVAEVIDRKLTISTAATSETIFSSLRTWSETESISSIVWMDNNRLYYEVTDDRAIHGYLIDVVLKTEKLIK